MSLFKANAIIQSFQTENPRLYDALRQLSLEIQTILSNAVIGPIIVDSENVFKIIGLKRDDRFDTIELTDRFDRMQLGGIPGATANGKLQVDEITNDHLNHEALTIKRERPDTVPPLTGFGADLSFRLQGFTVNTEPEAGRVQVIWSNDQTNDTTTRDSDLSLWNMLNNVLIRRFHISSSGVISFDSTVYPAGRFIYTGASGALTTDPQILYDDVNDIVTFISSSATNPQLHLRQDSTGDAYIRISLNGGVSFALGIDNSDSDKFKLSRNTAANAIPGTNDVFEVDTSNRLGFGVAASSTFKLRINKTTESTVLQLVHSDALTTPSEEIRQDSTGDASIRWQLAAGNSYILGIDNSDSDNFKLSYGASGNAVLGTGDFFAIDTAGRMGYGNIGPSTSVKFQIFDNTGVNTTFVVGRADALNTPIMQLNQTSTGDVTAMWTLGGGNSFAIGIDNSDNDYFKISYGSAANATVGVNDRLIIDLSGRFLIGVTGAVFTTGRLVQLNHFEEGTWLWCESTFVNPSIVLNNTGSGGQQYQLISTRTGGTGLAGALVIRDGTASQNRFFVAPNGNVIIGNLAALATTATNGFVYIPSCAGTPTGVPTAFTGMIPLVYDSTNNILYAYSGGAWRAH